MALGHNQDFTITLADFYIAFKISGIDFALYRFC